MQGFCQEEETAKFRRGRGPALLGRKEDVKGLCSLFRAGSMKRRSRGKAKGHSHARRG